MTSFLPQFQEEENNIFAKRYSTYRATTLANMIISINNRDSRLIDKIVEMIEQLTPSLNVMQDATDADKELLLYAATTTKKQIVALIQSKLKQI